MVMNYILPKEKNLESFFKACERTLYLDGISYTSRDFRDVLRIINTIEPSYSKLGYAYWDINIKEIAKTFINDYNKAFGGNVIKYRIIN